MKNIVVSVPTDKKVQKRISSMLGSIDDKIEENERINNNLTLHISVLQAHLFLQKTVAPVKYSVTISTFTI